MTDEPQIEWSPALVEQEIYRAAKRISNGVMKADTAYQAFLKADHAFDKVEAKCYVGLDGVPVHLRKYQVILDEDVQKARDARDVADAVYRLCDKNMKAIQGELDAYRSIGTSVRQAYQSAGVGER